MFYVFFLVGKKWARSALGARADPFTEADVHVRLVDPNRQNADEIAVRLGRPVGVALSCLKKAISHMLALLHSCSIFDIFSH